MYGMKGKAMKIQAKRKDAEEFVLRTSGGGYETLPSFVREHAPEIMAGLMASGEISPAAAARMAVAGAVELFDAMRQKCDEYYPQRTLI